MCKTEKCSGYNTTVQKEHIARN